MLVDATGVDGARAVVDWDERLLWMVQYLTASGLYVVVRGAQSLWQQCHTQPYPWQHLGSKYTIHLYLSQQVQADVEPAERNSASLKEQSK